MIICTSTVMAMTFHLINTTCCLESVKVKLEYTPFMHMYF